MCVATQSAKIQVGKVKSYSLQGVVSESRCEWAKNLTVRNVGYQDFISTPHRGDVRCHRRSREWRICRNPKKLRRYARKGEPIMDCVRTDEEISRVENWAVEGFDSGGRFPGMSYEQGIMDTIQWLRGDCDNAPDEA